LTIRPAFSNSQAGGAPLYMNKPFMIVHLTASMPHRLCQRLKAARRLRLLPDRRLSSHRIRRQPIVALPQSADIKEALPVQLVRHGEFAAAGGGCQAGELCSINPKVTQN
jgi:hypothetical protein